MKKLTEIETMLKERFNNVSPLQKLNMRKNVKAQICWSDGNDLLVGVYKTKGQYIRFLQIVRTNEYYSF